MGGLSCIVHLYGNARRQENKSKCIGEGKKTQVNVIRMVRKEDEVDEVYRLGFGGGFSLQGWPSTTVGPAIYTMWGLLGYTVFYRTSPTLRRPATLRRAPST